MKARNAEYYYRAACKWCGEGFAVIAHCGPPAYCSDSCRGQARRKQYRDANYRAYLRRGQTQPDEPVEPEWLGPVTAGE